MRAYTSDRSTRWNACPRGLTGRLAVAIAVGVLSAVGGVRVARAEAVVVTAPFIDLRTGPGRGYPITQSVLRGETIEILYRRTGYLKVRTSRNVEGWATLRDALRTTPESSSPTTSR